MPNSACEASELLGEEGGNAPASAGAAWGAVLMLASECSAPMGDSGTRFDSTPARDDWETPSRGRVAREEVVAELKAGAVVAAAAPEPVPGPVPLGSRLRSTDARLAPGEKEKGAGETKNPGS